MSRYKNTKIVKDRIKKYKVFTSTEYPIIERRDSDITYYVKFDDTYMSLAHRFYMTKLYGGLLQEQIIIL